MYKGLYITAALMLSLTIGLWGYKYLMPNGNQSPGPIEVDNSQSESQFNNPLLNATRTQFDRWLPAYCGPDLYLDRKVKPHAVEVCIEGTIDRIESNTGIKLTRDQVLDPRVRSHWRSAMGVK